jgi:hypothetical protein
MKRVTLNMMETLPKKYELDEAKYVRENLSFCLQSI